MGGAYGEFKRSKSKSFSNKFPFIKKSKRKITIENSSKIMNNFKEDNENMDDKQQSKTDRTFETQKKTNETIDKTDKSNVEQIKNLRSLSLKNLTKFEGGTVKEEIGPNSIDTNFSSNQSKGEIVNKLLYDEAYNEMERNNSIDDEEEEEDDEDEEKNGEENKDKDEDTNKINELMITNNIKTVFVESKKQGKEQNFKNDNSISINANDEESSSTRTSSATFDYELHFYKNANEIRESYISKLITKKVWNPGIKPKQHNSIIIFDWDDTLLPTSFLTPGGVFNENIILSDSDQEKLSTIEHYVSELLNSSVEKGNVFIITNAGKGWVEYSANRFYPSIKNNLKKIEIISARGEYEKLYPGNSREWKIQAFLTLLKFVNIKLVTNIICVGDSLFEMEAGRILASKFTEAFIKTIKFREAPKLDELIKQLKLVNQQFGTIYSSIKNLTIRVEKKKKEGN